MRISWEALKTLCKDESVDDEGIKTVNSVVVSSLL